MLAFDDGTPIYRQIAEQVKGDVLTGALREGDQVMSTNAYASHYRINPATAAKAFQLLVDEGVLHKRRGIGMFVSDGAPDRLRAETRERFLGEVIDDLVARARAIGIPLEEVVAHIQRRAQEERA